MTSKVRDGLPADPWADLFDDLGAPVDSRRLLGDILVEWELVTVDELEQALDVQRREGGRIGEILVTEGRLTLAQLMDAVSEQHGLDREASDGLRARLAGRRST